MCCEQVWHSEDQCTGAPQPPRTSMIQERVGLRLCVLLLFSCLIGGSDAAQANPIEVVTTTADLASLAQEVGGNQVHVSYLADGYEDPHYVQRDPFFLLKLRHADLLILIGLQLESTWLEDQFQFVAQSGNPRIQYGASGSLDVSRYADIADIPNQVSRAQGIHPLGNPHYWLDPENGRRISQAIATKLTEIRPDCASYFEQRFQAFTLRLTESEKVWDQKMRPYRGRRVITYHRAWTNFLMYFGLVSSGEIEPLPGIPPSAHHTNDLIRTMKRDDIRLIVVEPYFELTTPGRIARATGSHVLILWPSVGSNKQVTDYFKLLDCNVDLLVQAFSSF